MSYPPSEYGPNPESSESSADFADFNRAQEAWKTGQRNPLPLILAAKEWLEAAYEQIAEKLPQLAEKLPQPKKLTVPWCQAAFLDQAQQVGKKLKWW